MRYQEHGFFSTPDRDNSKWTCPKSYHGCFWFGLRGCFQAFPNGRYLHTSKTWNYQGIIWYTWKHHNYSLKSIEMKIRPYH